MRRFPRLDANHRAVVDFLRAHGVSVYSLAMLGKGCPDLLLGYRGWTGLMEVKAVGKVAAKPRLRVVSPDPVLESIRAGERAGLSRGAARSIAGEREWADRWRGGTVLFVSTPEDALESVTRACVGHPDREATVTP